MIGEPIADSRPFRGNTPYHMKIRNKRYKVNKNKIRLKTIGQNKQFMIVSQKVITDQGIGDEDFHLCRGNSDTLALDGDHFLPTHFTFWKEDNGYEKRNV